jgi:hypothetical protein
MNVSSSKNRWWHTLKRAFVLVCFSGLLSACNVEFYGAHIEDDWTPPPEIRAFTIVDSFDEPNWSPQEPVWINPYVNDGYFQIGWSVASSHYYVELFVSVGDGSYESVLLHALDAYAPSVNLICRYRTDVRIGCWLEGESERDAVYVDLMNVLNQAGYYEPIHFELVVWNRYFSRYENVYQRVEFQ